jgi:ATP-dependent protease Clp ATPase subunit
VDAADVPVSAASVARAIATPVPMVEGASDVFICAACIELCHNLIREEEA